MSEMTLPDFGKSSMAQPDIWIGLPGRPLLVTFAGGEIGSWAVERLETIAGRQWIAPLDSR